MAFLQSTLPSQSSSRILLVGLAIIAMLGGDASAQQAVDAATRQYAVAAAAQNRGDFGRAAEEWEKLISQFPDDPRRDRAFYYRGLCLLKVNKPAEAAAAFQALLETYPRSEWGESGLLNLGMAHYGQSQQGRPESYDQAVATLGTFLARFPASKSAPQAVFYLGECLYERGKKREAAERYADLLRKYPESPLVPEALYALAVAQQESGQTAAAERSQAEFLRRFADNPLATEVLMRRGDVLAALGQFEAAAELLEKAAAKPGFELADYAAFRHAAIVAQIKGGKDAVPLYLAMAERWPKSTHAAAARLAAGRTLFALGQYAAARSALANVGAGDELEFAHWVVRSWLKENRPAEALAAADKALQGKPAGPPTAALLLDRADALYELPKRRAEAAAAYAKAADSDPDAPDAAQARSMAALAAFGLGDYATALDQAKQFRLRWADSAQMPQATYVAAESELQLGHPERAAELYAELLEKWPRHANAAVWKVRRGAALFAAKKHKEAAAVLAPGLDAIDSPELRAEGQYLLGASRLELGQTQQAVEALRASLASAPRWRQADETWLALAQAQRRQGLTADGRASLETLIREFPESPVLDRAGYRLAETCYASGDLAAAAKQYDEVLKRWPKSPVGPLALYGLAWTRLGLNDFAGAEKAAGTLLERYPREKLAARGRYVRAIARQQTGRFQAAADDLKAFLAGQPERADASDARYALALCQVQMKQLGEAVASLEALLKDDPRFAGADKVLYELAWAEQSRSRPAEAVAAFRRLAAEHPDSSLAAESLFHVGDYDDQQGDHTAAAHAYHQACRKAGTSPLGEKAAYKLGWTYWRLDDYARAQESFAYQRATWPHGPLQADATFMEAECQAKLGKHEDALKLYAQVKSPQGKDFAVRALLGAGEAAAKLRRWPESLEWLDEALKQFPESPLVPEILGAQAWAQQNLGHADEALRLYAQVIAKTDREVAARSQFMIGRIQADQKKPAEALSSYVKVAYGYSYPEWQAAAAYEAGRCYEALGKTDRAVKQYEELLQQFPHSDQAGPAGERLKALRGK